MKNDEVKLKNIIFVIILLSLLYIVILLISFYFEEIYINKESVYIENSLGAFFGAFFAFLFLTISSLFSKIYNRNKRNYNALVRLEYLLNEYSVINSDNVFLMGGYLNKSCKFYVFNFTELEIDRSILTDLSNIDLINDVFSLNIRIYKNNKSLNTATRLYDEIKMSLLDKKIDEKDYSVNEKSLIIPSFKFLKADAEDLDEQIKDLIVKVRILVDKSKPVINLSPGHYSKNFKNMYNKERQIVENEYEEIKQKSENKIEEIKRKL